MLNKITAHTAAQTTAEQHDELDKDLTHAVNITGGLDNEGLDTSVKKAMKDEQREMERTKSNSR